VINAAQNPAFTAANQWFERTLDDSANKRLSIPEAFLAIDSILLIATNVTRGLIVNKKIIARRIREELPFMATENIMMASVKLGGDRQELHEAIRLHSHAASKRYKEEGKDLDLIERLQNDALFKNLEGHWKELLNPRSYIGRAPEQVSEFLKSHVGPSLKKHARRIQRTAVKLSV